MIDDNNTSQHSNKKKSFLIKKKMPEDALKLSKNLQSLSAGLSNYYIAPQASQNASFKPASRDDRNRSRYLNTSVSQKIPKQSDAFDHSEPQLTEIGERSQVEEEERKNLIEGPQLKMKKEYISFLVKTGTVGFDNVVVWNNGSAAIYYEWKRIESVRQQPNSIQDINEERFFCHHDQNVIKPGERIRFVFSFLSKITGIFNEEWQLKCEPPCLQPLPNLKLTGIANVDDELTNKRKEFEVDIKNKFSLKIATEIVEDVMEEVKTPPPPKPNLEDPDQFKIEFEELNLNEQMYFLPETMNLFKYSHQEIQELTQQQFEWNADVKVLRNQIQHIEEEEDKELVLRKLELWSKLAKKVPITRNPMYSVVYELLGNAVDKIPGYANDLRGELQMWDYVFKVPEDLTPEQQKQKQDEYNKMKADWLKKAKKKKWNEELEKELVDEYRGKLGEKVSECLNEVAIQIENDGALLSVGALMKPELKWNNFRRRRIDQEYWEQLLKKKTIVDSDIEGKKVGLKIHLKLADRLDALQLKEQFEDLLIKEQEEENKRLEEERLEKERQAQEAAKKKGKGKPQQLQKQQNQKEEEVIQDKPKERDLSHLDKNVLDESVEILKTLLERQAKLIILLVSYDNPSGKYKFTSSTKFYYEWLKTQLECPVYFSDTIIDNLDEQLENQTYQENAVLVLENLFFQEDETGYEEEPDDEAKTPYRTLLPYGQIYVIGDRVNFFSKFYPSIIHMNADQTILSNTLAKDIQIISHNIQGCQNRNGTVIIGGELSGDKLLVIDQLAGHVSSIILMGKMGLAFYLTMYDIQSDLINESVRNVIKNLLNTLQDEAREKPPQRLTRISHLKEQIKPKSRILCPQDFLITKLPEEYDPSNPEHVEVVTSSVTPYIPEDQITLEEGYILLDYGPQTIEMISKELFDSQRLFWIDDANLGLHQIEKTITVPDFEAIALLKKLKEEEAQREQERLEKLKEKKGTKQKKKVEEEPKQEINIKTTKDINVPVFNQTNRALGNLLYEMNQQKKERHQHAQKSGHFLTYDFNQDCIITIIGDRLQQLLNQEDFAQTEDEQKSQGVEQSPGLEQEGLEQEQESQKGSNFQSDEDKQQDGNLELQEEKVKINQVKQYLSDFYIQDQEFILKLLAGNQIHIHSLDEYPPKPESEINEEQYFEDETP